MVVRGRGNGGQTRGMKQPTKTAADKPLAPRQQRFVDEYLIDLNGTQAAIRAGYSARSAAVTAATLLRNPKIATALAAGKAARSEQTGIDAAWVLRRLADEASADMSDLYDEAGDLKHPKDWPEVWRRGLVVGVETFQVPIGKDDEGKPLYAPVRKVRLTDRIKQLELIGKHIGVNAFREQLGVSSPTGGPLEMTLAVELPAIEQAIAKRAKS